MTGEPAQPSQPGLPWLAVFVGPLLALALYAWTATGTFLSDDFLLNTMLTHAGVPSVDWSEIVADFTRSWAGLEDSHLYRPFVSLSFGVTFAAFGADPLPFHVTNILVHCLGSLACALLCAACAPNRQAFAAALGGACFALHPAAAEPTCWIASRTAGLQVMFATAALACFASYLRRGRPGRVAWSAGFFVCALLCKESAVLVPVSMLALDAMLRRGVPLRARWPAHAVMFTILAGYFALRLAVLGTLIGGGDEGVRSIQSDAVLAVMRDKFAVLLFPVGNGLPPPWGLVSGGVAVAALAGIVLPGLFTATSRLVALGGLAWIALYFAPTFRLPLDPTTLGGSRMVYGATTIFAVWLTTIATRSASNGPRDWRLAGTAVLLIVSLGALATARLTQYLRAYEDMRHLQQSLASHATTASTGQPLAMVSINPAAAGIPFLNCNALYPLAERPIAKHDTPLVSLGFMFQPVPRSEHLLFDSGPARAMRELGATLLDWTNDRANPQFQVRRRSTDTPPALPPLELGKPGWFRALAGPIDPWNVEAVEIEVEGACSGGRLEWLYFKRDASGAQAIEPYIDVEPPIQFRDAPAFARLPAGGRRGDRTVFYVDLSHHMTFVVTGLLGGLAGFHVVLEGDDARAVRVTMLPRVETLELPERLADAAVHLAHSSARLRAPELPVGATAMTLYLVGPDTTLTTVVRPGPVDLPPDIQEAIAIILRSSRQKRYYLYFEATGEKTWRSPVDWLRFER